VISVEFGFLVPGAGLFCQIRRAVGNVQSGSNHCLSVHIHLPLTAWAGLD